MYIDNPMDTAAVLAHEMVHGVIGCQHGHKKPFRDLALAIGLEGKMTSTTAGPDFIKMLEPILKKLGPYPHAKIDASATPKQGTRLIKVECPDCGFNVRITRTWLDSHGGPICPQDELEMVEPTTANKLALAA